MVDCLGLVATGPDVAPAPATLTITDARQGKADTPVMRSMTFQLTAEEVCVALDKVTSIYLLFMSLFMLIFLLISCVCF